MQPYLPPELFQQRYARATTLASRTQKILLIFALILIAFFVIRIRLLWAPPLLAITYAILNRLLFSRWSTRAIHQRIAAATSTASAEITQLDTILGFNQAAYLYEWEGRRYTFFDFLSPTEAATAKPGQIIDIHLDPFRPRQSYIAPPKERIIG